MASETCPKCEQPRLADSLDCPYCGIVYDRYRGERNIAAAGDAGRPTPSPAAAPAPAAASTTPAPSLPDLYDGPAPGAVGEPHEPTARPAMPRVLGDGAVEHEETLLTRHLGLSLLVVLLLAVALYGFWSRQMFGLWENLGVARQSYARLTGFPAPDGLDDGMLWSLAGRKLVVLEESGVADDELGLTAIVFHPGSMGGRPEQEALLREVAVRIQRLGIPHRPVGNRTVEVRGAQARSRTWLLGNEGVTFGRVAALAFEAPDGRPALLVVAGPSDAVARVMREVLL